MIIGVGNLLMLAKFWSVGPELEPRTAVWQSHDSRLEPRFVSSVYESVQCLRKFCQCCSRNSIRHTIYITGGHYYDYCVRIAWCVYYAFTPSRVHCHFQCTMLRGSIVPQNQMQKRKCFLFRNPTSCCHRKDWDRFDS